METALLQHLLNIAQRQRIAKIPPDRTKDDAGFGLTPFEDRRSGSHFAILSSHQPATLKVATHPAKVYMDEAVGYDLLRRRCVHDTVNHAETYVNGQVHTNSLENFWSLLKRNLSGTYVAVEPFHLDRYLDEQMFRFNNRINKKDADRFNKLVLQIVGKQLTYAELTGKESQKQAF